jgi:hypothetical protein
VAATRPRHGHAGRIHLGRLKLAADVLLSEAGAIPEPLEELSIFRYRVERALLLPVRHEPISALDG